MSTMPIVIGMRHHDRNNEKEEELLFGALQRNSQFGHTLLVVKDDQSGIVTRANRIENVHAFTVKPWGSFVPALNMLILQAKERGAEQILFTSSEVVLKSEIITILREEMEEQDAWVVGAALADHDFCSSRTGKVFRAENARQFPWNSCALWRMKNCLQERGFLLVSELGMEEVPFFSLYYQAAMISGGPLPVAILKKCPIEPLDTSAWDEERWAKHQKKIVSKTDRAKFQLDQLGLAWPLVMHVE